MSIESVLLFVFSSIGLTHIIVDSSLLSVFRNLMERILPSSVYEVFKCYQCCGFWCGSFAGYFLLVRTTSLPWWLQVIQVVLCGCAGSFLSQWGAIYLNVLEAKMIVTYKDEK